MAHKVETTQETRAAAAAKTERRPEAPPPSGASNQLQGSSLKPLTLTAQERNQRIAELAHQKASQRGFEPGAELDDWLAAEREVNAQSAVEGSGGLKD